MHKPASLASLASREPRKVRGVGIIAYYQAMGRGKRALRSGGPRVSAKITHSENLELLIGPEDDTPGLEAANAEAAARELAAMPEDVVRRRLKGGLIIDLDDTLIVNHPLFLRSRAALVEVFAELDPSRDRYEMGLHQREVSNAMIPQYGFTPRRWYEGSLEVARNIAGRELSEAERTQVLAAAEIGVGIGEFYPGVQQALAVLKKAAVPMVLLTKGEESKQREKIAGHGLERYFDNIVITAHKDAALLREVVERHQLQDPVVIGDSEFSDIKPATEAGYDSVLVDRGAPKWIMERHEGEFDTLQAPSFPEGVLSLVSS